MQPSGPPPTDLKKPWTPILGGCVLHRARSLSSRSEFEKHFSLIEQRVEEVFSDEIIGWLGDGTLGQSLVEQFRVIEKRSRNCVWDWRLGMWRRYPDTLAGVWKWIPKRRASFSDLEVSQDLGGLVLSKMRKELEEWMREWGWMLPCILTRWQGGVLK